MGDEQFRQYIEIIRQQIAVSEKEQVVRVSHECTAALEGLQLIHEEMQTSLEAAEVIEEELYQQNEQVSAGYHYYYDLFYSSPIPYLVTDVNGLILDANQAIAQLLNVPHRCLVGKPLAAFITQTARPTFRSKLNQLSAFSDLQIWQIEICPRKGKPFVAELNVAIVRNDSGWIEALQIGVYNMSRTQPMIAQQLNPEESSELMGVSILNASVMPTLPQSLDGLQVLIVDDEADTCEFITAVLESQGICVMSVATAAEALEILERCHPDVLVSDIRMPHEDGYSLIHKVRELEAKQRWHIPAAALTAYSEENREKALSAGFEAHLHKLSQPSKLIELVAQLAGRAST